MSVHATKKKKKEKKKHWLLWTRLHVMEVSAVIVI